MAQFPALPLWTDALLADTDHLSDQEFGLYMRLLILMWRTPRFRVPNDESWLEKRLCQRGSDLHKSLKPLMREYCTSTGNHLKQKRLTREADHLMRMSERGSANAKSRWDKEKAAYKTDAKPMPDRCKIDAPTPTPIGKKKESKTLNGGAGSGEASGQPRKQAPRHGSFTKDHRRVWFNIGTPEWSQYADDYRSHHHGVDPPTQWGGAGSWFNWSGEAQSKGPIRHSA